MKIFLQAIIDTQTAFNTGKLNNTEGEPLASSLPFKKLSNQDDIDTIKEVYSLLQTIRNYVTEQSGKGNIIQQHNYIEFSNDYENKISTYLNDKRSKAIKLVNKVLIRNTIDPIKSGLLTCK